MLLPRALKHGDEVAVVAPSGAVRDRAALLRGLDRLRSWGLSPTVLSVGDVGHGLDWPDGSTLAAVDDDRLACLQQALDDGRYRAVFCARGGYGAGRLLERLSWSAFAGDPKPIVGYSDITALLAAAAAEVQVVTFHGPMVATTDAMDAGDEGWRGQRQLLTDAHATALPEAAGAYTMHSGAAEGILVGGNLAVLQATIGTRWQPRFDGALVCLEDIGEAPYRVDRMLTHLLQATDLRRAAGIVLGDFHVDGTELAALHAPMQQVLAERLGGLGVPVAAGMPFGHRPGSWTLPFGVRARLDAPDATAAPTLRLLQAAVR